jgi:hypothetical protein
MLARTLHVRLNPQYSLIAFNYMQKNILVVFSLILVISLAVVFVFFGSKYFLSHENHNNGSY